MTTDQRVSATSRTRSGPDGRVGARAAAGDAGPLGRARDLARHGRSNLLVEYARNDVFGPELLLGHAGGDGMRRRELHLVVDEPGADVEEPAEEAREAEHVVDLVRVVAAPGSHDLHVTQGLLWLDLGHRVGHREDDAVARHAL